uniref:peroxidase n=1 Tax=Quercus lobata TaxID=97700 RepID=A0A7N2MTF3_QUELO
MAAHSASSFLVIVSLAVLVIFTGSSSAKLSTNFYSKSCPKVFITVQSVVHSAISKQPLQGASLLRLHFHDCLPNVINSN